MLNHYKGNVKNNDLLKVMELELGRTVETVLTALVETTELAIVFIVTVDCCCLKVAVQFSRGVTPSTPRVTIELLPSPT